MYCSNCGKQIAEGSKFCSFCGATQAIVTNAVVMTNATPVATPIVKPVSEEHKDLSLRLEKAANVLDTLPGLEKTIKENGQYVQNVKNGRIKCTFFASYAPFFGVGLGIPFFTLMCGGAFVSIIENAVQNSTIAGITTAVVFLVPIGMGVAILLLGIPVAKKMQEKRQRKLEEETLPERENKLNEAIETTNRLLTDEFWETVEIVPESYRYGFAMRTIAGYFKNGRAETLKEALNLFETEKHQWRMEEIQIQQAAQITSQLNSIRTSSAISAGANVANAFYNFSR